MTLKVSMSASTDRVQLHQTTCQKPHADFRNAPHRKVYTPFSVFNHDLSLALDPLRYEVIDGEELAEDEDLAVPGETSLADYNNHEGEGHENNIPIRLLQDFTIYDIFTNDLIPTGELMQLEFTNHVYGASGIAKPWIENDDEQEEDDDDDDDDNNTGGLNSGQRIKLTRILEFDTHYYSEVTKCFDRFV